MKEDKIQKTLDKLKWVEQLPQNNVDWAAGILEIARKLEQELAQTQAEKEELDKRVKGLRKMLFALPARAAREATLLYTEEEILSARRANL
jgi:cell division protein FtsB